jgi:hypothetical protein
MSPSNLKPDPEKSIFEFREVFGNSVSDHSFVMFQAVIQREHSSTPPSIKSFLMKEAVKRIQEGVGAENNIHESGGHR